MTEQTEPKGTPVVVTTEHRGVFFGWIDPAFKVANTVDLAQAQMCVYWSSDIHGILGLAATGPTKSCRITPPVPSITLHKVTSVIDSTEEAVAAWQAKPWSRS